MHWGEATGGHSERVAVHKPGGGHSSRTELSGNLTLEYPVCGLLLWQLEETNIIFLFLLITKSEKFSLKRIWVMEESRGCVYLCE